MASRALSREESDRFNDCVVCDRLSTESAALLCEYNAAIDALAATSRRDPLYEDRWATLSRVSDRLHKAQKVARLHRGSHLDSQAKPSSALLPG
jgi:hypothetical protein